MEQFELPAPVKIGEKTGYIDALGRVVIEPVFEGGTRFHEGRAAVWNGEKYGFIDASGEVVIDYQFGDRGDFREGLARFSYESLSAGKIGFIDKAGQVVIPPRFERAFAFQEGLAAVQENKKWGFIAREGEFAIPPQFDWCWHFSEGLAAVSLGGKWGFIDRSGTVVIAAQFRHAWNFSEGLAMAQHADGKLGFINRAGEFQIEPRLDHADSFHEGLAVISFPNTKMGFIDPSGKVVIPTEFTAAYGFSEGLAPAYVGGKMDIERLVHGGKWGYIDRQGQMKIKPQFDGAENFSNGIAQVQIGDMVEDDYAEGYINKTAEYIWEPTRTSGLPTGFWLNMKAPRVLKQRAHFENLTIKKNDTAPVGTVTGWIESPILKTRRALSNEHFAAIAWFLINLDAHTHDYYETKPQPVAKATLDDCLEIEVLPATYQILKGRRLKPRGGPAVDWDWKKDLKATPGYFQTDPEGQWIRVFNYLRIRRHQDHPILQHMKLRQGRLFDKQENEVVVGTWVTPLNLALDILTIPVTDLGQDGAPGSVTWEALLPYLLRKDIDLVSICTACRLIGLWGWPKGTAGEMATAQLRQRLQRRAINVFDRQSRQLARKCLDQFNQNQPSPASMASYADLQWNLEWGIKF